MLKNTGAKIAIDESDIKWVIPVPVVWNSVSYEFIKEAAESVSVSYFFFLGLLLFLIIPLCDI